MHKESYHIFKSLLTFKILLGSCVPLDYTKKSLPIYLKKLEKCKDLNALFALNFILRIGEKKDLYITLHKLNIVDMLEPPDSPAKFLFKSRHRARLPANMSSSAGLLFTPSKRRHS